MKTQVTDAPVSEVEQAVGGATTGDDATVKPVRAEPPLAAGMAQVMVADVARVVAVAVTAVGAPGLPVITAVDAAEARPDPKAFVAVTVKV